MSEGFPVSRAVAVHFEYTPDAPSVPEQALMSAELGCGITPPEPEGIEAWREDHAALLARDPAELRAEITAINACSDAQLKAENEMEADW